MLDIPTQIGKRKPLMTCTSNDCSRLAAAGQISVLNDCGNRYLTLAAFWGGCPLTSEADLPWHSAGWALPSQRRGPASDRSLRQRTVTSDPYV